MKYRGDVIFLGSSRCFHTMDWYNAALKISPQNPPVFITDLIEGEGYQKLLNENDMPFRKLFIIDSILYNGQSRFGNIWRNLVKLLFIPLQVLKLRLLLNEFNDPIIHAHTMYYAVLARLSGAKFIATAQGDELLVRPQNSSFYFNFAKFGLEKARYVIVDSSAMKDAAKSLYDIDAKIVQYGIDLKAIQSKFKDGLKSKAKSKFVSMRGIDSNYQNIEILKGRDLNHGPSITFCYPFVEQGYFEEFKDHLRDGDEILGRLNRDQLHTLLNEAVLSFSIPKSDSSPRSVYEAIFCGSPVAATDLTWIETLPDSMRSRVIKVDIKDPNWFSKALQTAEDINETEFVPCQKALETFDQDLSMLIFYRDIYPKVNACVD